MGLLRCNRVPTNKQVRKMRKGENIPTGRAFDSVLVYNTEYTKFNLGIIII